MSAEAPLYPRVYGYHLVRRLAGVAALVMFLSTCSSSAPPASPSVGAYDGQWFASVPPQGKCDFPSHLTINVAGRSLTGHAANPAGVFSLSGSVDGDGDGKFTIGAFDGKIKFSGDSFEANYAANCGPRQASGARMTAKASTSASDQSGSENAEDTAQKLAELAALVTKKGEPHVHLDICGALDLMRSNPECEFYRVVYSRNATGDFRSYNVFPGPGTDDLRIIVAYRNSQDRFYYLLSRDGKLDRAIHIGGDGKPEPISGDGSETAAQAQAEFWASNIEMVEELWDRPRAP